VPVLTPGRRRPREQPQRSHEADHRQHARHAEREPEARLAQEARRGSPYRGWRGRRASGAAAMSRNPTSNASMPMRSPSARRPRSLGYGLPRRAFLREASLGLALGVASMLAVVGLMTALGLLAWAPAAGVNTGTQLLRLVALRLVSGFAVAFIEETFLRGAMHTAIERESGTRLAVLLTALLYARRTSCQLRHPAGQVTPRSGLELLAGTACTLGAARPG